ncbi:MAG: hypothetical protein P1Q69_15880 [Candidatus Thorarchaeota archaeon]|nr:hypothetical protein [Candidatus Thorarchaeota archaeon]
MNIEHKIVVMYVVLPLLVLSFALPAFSLITPVSAEPSMNRVTLKDVGLMIPVTSDPINDVHLGSKAAIDTYNSWYGSDESIGLVQSLNSVVTAYKFKTETRYRDRVQVVSHGSMTAYGPRVDLYGSNYLQYNNYAYWASSYGDCELVVLAACYSLGAGGAGDFRLANAIKDRTPVKAVVGFNGIADLFPAYFLVMNFWWQHVAGYRYNDQVGGYNAETSVSRSIWLLEGLMSDAFFTAGLLIGAAVGYFVGPIVFSVRGIAERILQTIFKNGITQVLWDLFLAGIYDTMDAFTFTGSFVGSLITIGGGSGGGGGGVDVPF